MNEFPLIEKHSSNTVVIVSQFCDYAKKYHAKHFQASELHSVWWPTQYWLLARVKGESLQWYQVSFEAHRKGPRLNRSGQG